MNRDTFRRIFGPPPTLGALVLFYGAFLLGLIAGYWSKWRERALVAEARIGEVWQDRESEGCVRVRYTGEGEAVMERDDAAGVYTLRSPDGAVVVEVRADTVADLVAAIDELPDWEASYVAPILTSEGGR